MKEMIDKIYEVIADKTQSNGCIIEHKDGKRFTSNGIGGQLPISDKIIGHPVMIGDVIDWTLNNTGRGSDDGFSDPESQQQFAMGEICIKWDLYREPIENQPKSTILFIYNLIEGQEKKN